MKDSEGQGNIARLVEQWLAGKEPAVEWPAVESTLYETAIEEPEIAWQAVLEIAGRTLTEDQQALLAAGPLETLLASHGARFIDRVVAEADRSSRFRWLLGGVWRQDMPDAIWDRVKAARKDVKWD